MKCINYKSENGFILLDALIATVILSMALVALVGLVTMGVNTSNANNNQMKAYQIASGYADALQTLSTTNWNTQITSTTYTQIDLSSANPVVYNCLFNTNSQNAQNNLTTLPGANVTIFGKQSSLPQVNNALVQLKIIVAWNNGTQSVQLLKYYISNIN